MAKKTPEEVVALLVDALTPKKEKKPKRNKILVINGVVCSDMVSMKEAKKVAKRLAVTDSKIELYEKTGELTVDLPVEVK
jgi:hypothetical protein